jgi:hypothetical protein
MDPKEEYMHEWPADVDKPWKENFYFNFVDRKNNAFGFNHVSLMRHKQKGRFTCVHVVDGQILPYSNKIDITDLTELTDGKLSMEFIEPFKKFRVRFDGPRHQLDLNYDATFPVCTYDKPGGSKGQPLSVDHYRQSLKATGTITFKDETRKIECFCDRDHTWGYRDEGGLTGWNWAGAYFPDKTYNFHRIIMGKAFYAVGYLSNAEGNTKLRVEIKDTEFDGDAPISSVFIGKDEKGEVVGRLKTEKFHQLKLPMVDKEGVVIYETFSEFTDLDTGEKADGVDEYLINPKDNFYKK